MLKIAFLMDPISEIRCLEDTTFALMEEACRHGHRIFHLEPEDLVLDSAKGFRLNLKEVTLDPIEGIQVKKIFHNALLSFLDALWLRKDPPFDLDYFHHLLLLAMHEDQVLMLNRPSSIILGNEKLLPFYFRSAMPKTIVSAQKNLANLLKTKSFTAIWKPLSERSGRGVTALSKKSQIPNSHTWGLAQEFLPAIRKTGDLRIFLLDGKFLAAYRRFPQKGKWLISPESEDGPLKPARLTQKEIRSIKRIGPWLEKRGLYFVGLDMIGGKLTEINVTSPGGLVEAELFQKGKSLSRKVIDLLERKIKSF